MRLQSLKLYSSDLDKQKIFYTDVLGFELLREEEEQFWIQVGKTRLEFVQRVDSRPYHFAINIPSNQEMQALNWIKERVEILGFQGDELIDFSGWNARAMYFYDADRNIVEFISRRNLGLQNDQPFGLNALIQISEIGVPVDEIEKIFRQLNQNLDLPIYDGNFRKFCAVGGEELLFIVIDKNKKLWFPTDDEAFGSPFEAKVESKGVSHQLSFEGNHLHFY